LGVGGRGSGADIDGVVRAHGGVLTAGEAAKAGLTRHAVQWAVQKDVLRPLRRGVYTTTALWQEATPEGRHVLEILGQQRAHPRLTACETSAAIVLSLPTPSGPPTQPYLTASRPVEKLRRGAPGARGHRGGQVTRRSLLSNAEVWNLTTGVRVTSPIRTVLDCARVWDRPWGLAAADAAITKWGVVPTELMKAWADRTPTAGHQKVQWVVEHARAKVESPLESLGRAVVVMAGFPEPQPQVWVRTQAGGFRVDLLDEANKVIIEADGKLKYTSPQDVWREKRREDALRDSGFEVVRFTFADYHNQAAWLPSYRRAVARGSGRVSTG
jgi:hypothetical protein